MKNIIYNTTFIRKIHINKTIYYVEQNKEKETMTIRVKTGRKKQVIYRHCNKENKIIYDDTKLEIIKSVFKIAHIDRYVLKRKEVISE